MRVGGNTSVNSILSYYPPAREVFDWHGVTTADVDTSAPLGCLCSLLGVDLSEVLLDLEFSMEFDGYDLNMEAAVA